MTKTVRSKSQLRKAIGVLGPIFHQYRGRLLLGLSAMIFVDAMQLSIPRIIKSVVDGLNTSSLTKHDLINHAFLIGGLAVAIGIFRFIWRYLVIGFSRLLERDIRNKLFSHILTLDKPFFHKKTTGDIIALSTNDLTAVQMACGMGLVAFVDAFIMLFFAISFMFYINAKLTIIALIPLPLLAVTTKILAKRLHMRFKSVQEQFSSLTQFARSTITSIRLVKISNQEDNQTSIFNKLGRRYVDNNVGVARVQGVLFPLSTMIANFSLLLVVLYGGRLAIMHTISIGDLVAFISYLFMLTWPMMAIGWVANLFQRGLTSLERIKDVLDTQPLISSSATNYVHTPLSHIQLTRFNFTYPGSQTEVLHSINLELSPGLFGLVGPTGSGKSTLCDILARLYPIASDSIFLNGIDLNQLHLASVRKQIAYVPQTTHLFSDTITFNISLAKPEATQEEIETAATMADIHQEIRTFPDGYKTRIGEKGVKLSGGQKQRIALARALLADTPLLIIDDGLSAVDADTESHIIANLSPLFKQKIVVYASHRLTPLAASKCIIVLENGHITAQGPSEDLIQKNSFFSTIYHHQNGTLSTLKSRGTTTEGSQ